MRSTPITTGTLFGLLILAGCPDEESSGACQADSACKGDRICVDGMCVDPNGGDSTAGDSSMDSGSADDGSMDTGGETSNGGSASDTGSASADGGSTTMATDPCEEAGGTVSPDGACLLECEYDEMAPGNDLFRDCAPLQMVCTGEDYCAPDDFCDENTDCGEGFACTHFQYWSPQCRPLCAGGGPCPAGTSCEQSTSEFWPELPELMVCHNA